MRIYLVQKMRQISQPQHVMVLPITNIDQYWVLVNIDRRDDVNYTYNVRG